MDGNGEKIVIIAAGGVFAGAILAALGWLFRSNIVSRREYDEARRLEQERANEAFHEALKGDVVKVACVAKKATEGLAAVTGRLDVIEEQMRLLAPPRDGR